MLFITGPWIKIKDMPNWQRILEKIGEDLEKKHQHYTTSTKLHFAEYHYVKITLLIPNRKATDIMKIDPKIQEAVFDDEYLRKTVAYLSELDALLYTLRSCIDSFLWEINLIFELGCERVTDIRCLMNIKYNRTKTNKLLKHMSNKSWFKYLNRIRNNLIHRKLSEIATYTENLHLYLPSNPKGEITDKSYSMNEDFEVVSCINKLLNNVKEFLEIGYGLIIDDMFSTNQR